MRFGDEISFKIEKSTGADPSGSPIRPAMGWNQAHYRLLHRAVAIGGSTHDPTRSDSHSEATPDRPQEPNPSTRSDLWPRSRPLTGPSFSSGTNTIKLILS